MCVRSHRRSNGQLRFGHELVKAYEQTFEYLPVPKALNAER